MSAVPVFWAIALALVALTVAVLLWPLLRRGRAKAPSEEAARLAVYRDQKRQLDDDVTAGVLSPANHGVAMEELTRRLGIELDRAGGELPPPAPERLGLLAALVVVAVIPVGAILLYLVLGVPDALRAQTAAEGRPSDREIVAMVESLAAKMKANPTDPKGWRLLGRSYAALGRYDDASTAYAEAVRRGGDDPDVLTDWAEAMALAHNRRVSGEPERLATRALALRPEHAKALALLATAAFERRDFDGSIQLWRRLQTTLPAGSEEITQTQAAIAEIQRVRDNTAQAPRAPATEADSATASAAPAPSAETRTATTAGSDTRAGTIASADTRTATTSAATDTRAGAIAGQVDVAPALAARAASGDTLYVFARAAGSRMPVAVLRTPAGAWPRSFELDDSMSMAGGTRLSAAASVTVEARLSHSGDATPHAGDLIGRGGEVKPGARDVRIVLDGVVP